MTQLSIFEEIDELSIVMHHQFSSYCSPVHTCTIRYPLSW